MRYVNASWVPFEFLRKEKGRIVLTDAAGEPTAFHSRLSCLHDMLKLFAVTSLAHIKRIKLGPSF